MALYTPTYDGVALFGPFVRMKHIPNATANQVNAFFGVSGQTTLFGGERAPLTIQGVWLEPDPALFRTADQALLMSYADGIPRVLTDTFGASWPAVIFKGELQEGELAFNPNGMGGFALPFRCVFYGLL